MTGIGVQSFVGVIVVLGLVVGLAWLLRRGAFGALGAGSRSITVETAMPLGERRSLVIVAVEGRRLLLGMTPGQISMVTELEAPAPAPAAPATGGGPQSFEQLLVARAKDMFTRRGPSATDPHRQSFAPVLARVKGMWSRPGASPDGAGSRVGDVLKLGVQAGSRDACAEYH